MESQNSLDTRGDLRINSTAELLAEIAQNSLNGSLRLSNAAQKIAVYFAAGKLVFAVSNARQHRLFDILLQAEKLTKEQLTAITDFTNDLALKENLLKNSAFSPAEINDFFSRQISGILETALGWNEGEWTFSPLVRIKNDIRFTMNVPARLIEFGRNFPIEKITGKFSDAHESFEINDDLPTDVNMSPHESFVFSRFEKSAMSAEEIQLLSGLPEAETRRILYALWLGGFLKREYSSAAFSKRKIAAIASARLALKKDEQTSAIAQPIKSAKIALVETKSTENTENIVEEKPVERQISLEDYLKRTEEATNHYEVFALAPDAAVADIKQSYFNLAKRFHPDLFYKTVEVDLLHKIQTAFSQLAQAYDTLKTASSREVYDFKMRKELAEMKAVQSEETTVEEINQQKQFEQAEEHFKLGFGLLMDGNAAAAAPLLARAVHFDSENARYRAYYGKALADNIKLRHKAESEMQAAIKLDHENATYRIMLAEFFIQFNLMKRAEGELNRLLAIHPKHIEAQTLLDSLSKK